MPVNNYESSFPYITGNTVRAQCNYILDHQCSFNPTQVQCGDTIFTMVDYLDYFFTVFHPQIKHPYILVTHNFYDSSDNVVPGTFAQHLDDPKLFAWVTQNVDREHPKLHAMPIGLANTNYEHGDVEMFNKYIEKAKRTKKSKLLYMNFSVNTYAQERQFVYDLFKNKPFCTNAKRRSATEYLKELTHHQFVLSPRGNGLDCHRTWEALLMGCYPVVRSSWLNPLYKDLPVVIVNNWHEVTEQLLREKYEEFSRKEFSVEKLYMPYWLNYIHNLQEQARKL
jgi:hypothetical protein